MGGIPPPQRQPDPGWACTTRGAMADVEGAPRPQAPVVPGPAGRPGGPPAAAGNVRQCVGDEPGDPDRKTCRSLCVLLPQLKEPRRHPRLGPVRSYILHRGQGCEKSGTTEDLCLFLPKLQRSRHHPRADPGMRHILYHGERCRGSGTIEDLCLLLPRLRFPSNNPRPDPATNCTLRHRQNYGDSRTIKGHPPATPRTRPYCQVSSTAVPASTTRPDRHRQGHNKPPTPPSCYYLDGDRSRGGVPEDGSGYNLGHWQPARGANRSHDINNDLRPPQERGTEARTPRPTGQNEDAYVYCVPDLRSPTQALGLRHPKPLPTALATRRRQPGPTGLQQGPQRRPHTHRGPRWARL